ncbi:MAG: radical SAM protein [Spirochaetales bacterium]|nr:radical SAM protein [Spirochaetales bacterium]
MIHYNEPLFRPPSEADSLIIQATLGCSHNQCTFCSMYKSKRYTEKSYEQISGEIEAVSSYSEVRRVFIADGDAMALDTAMLLKIFNKLHNTFPRLRRISIYANTGNILNKTDNELESLSRGGLSIIYLGFESGSNLILGKIKKGVSKEEHKLAAVRAKSCNLDLSATIITGLGGKKLWKEHIEQSADLVNMTAPKYLSTLSLMIDPNCRDRFTTPFETGFTPQDDVGILQEEKLLISLINSPERIIFRSNHASNVLALSGRLPGDKEKLIKQIDQALSHGLGVRPSWMRGL